MTQSITKSTVKIPPLENGDLEEIRSAVRLTRLEFETRYQNMTHVKKAELIEGIVYLGSPVKINQHGAPHANIMTWLGFYKAYTNGVQIGDNCTVRLDPENEPQPDALLRIEKGGQSLITEDGYVEGAPELIVEIAASTVSIDLHDKLKAYRRNQVKEYLVWRVDDNEIDWFRLKEEKYIKLQADEKGIIESEIYPGLWLDVNSLLKGDLATVLNVLQQGINTSEHKKFAEELSINDSI